MINLFDVSKGNNKFLFIFSIPFIIVTAMFFGLSIVFSVPAMMIGRQRAFNMIYNMYEGVFK